MNHLHPLLMKKLFTIFIALFFATSAAAFAAESSPEPTAQFGTITVHISGMKNLPGMFGVSLYNSKKGFPGKHEQACASSMKTMSSNDDTVVFDHLPYGSYAVSVMHDENNNGKLDTNWIGIPKEGVGVSNNPKIGMGGPKFDDSVFTLDKKELEVTIAIKYRN